MRGKTFAPVVVLLVACHGGNYPGDDVGDDGGGDDAGFGVVSVELGAPTTLYAGVDAILGINDASFLAIVRDPVAGDARLVSHDVRDGSEVELDRIPVGDGAGQIVQGRTAIVWGYGGVELEAGTFRVVPVAGEPHDLVADGATPSLLLAQDTESIIYHSKRDCTVEMLSLASTTPEVRGRLSCFAEVTSVMHDNILGIWLRVEDSGETAVGMMDGLWTGEISYARTGMEAAIGPFAQTDTYFFIEDSGGDAHFYYGATHQWPVPAPIGPSVLPTPTFDLGTLVDGRVLAVSVGPPTTFYAWGADVITESSVAYTPVHVVGLHERVIALLADGTLIEQSLVPL
jgi:hypothetical protein